MKRLHYMLSRFMSARFQSSYRFVLSVRDMGTFVVGAAARAAGEQRKYMVRQGYRQFVVF